MLFSVIMAGGRGKRFWPVSTEEEPKQFLSIVGDKPLITQTKERISPLVPEDRIRVVTTGKLTGKILDCGFKEENLIVEPQGMNTLYAIALSAAKIYDEDSESIMLVLPSDHWIGNEERFREVLRKGVRWAEEGNLVTYGIVPSRPETGYGYIEKGKRMGDNAVKVKRFTEKPNLKKAAGYLKTGNYLWNSGIFLWKSEVILEEIMKYQQQISDKVKNLMDNPSNENIESLYKTGDPISIDYGVLERSKKVTVIESDFTWDDVGAWSSLERIYEENESGNIKKGEVLPIHSQDNIFYSASDGIIVAKNLSKMVVVHTDKATLILPKSDAQEVKEIIRKIPDKYK